MSYAAATALLTGASDVREAHGINVHDVPDTHEADVRRTHEATVHGIGKADVRKIGGHDSLPDGVTRVRFASMILLDKQETFEACSVIASARDRLAATGYVHEVEALASLFAVLESRLLDVKQPTRR